MSREFRTPAATYEVVSTLRERPTGGTHRVRRQLDGAELILKELTIGQIKDWKQFDLFEREIAAVKSIDHPRVPKYVDSHLDEDTGHFILVQTQIVGTTLREVMTSRGMLPPHETEAYLRQALELLEYLHGSSPPVVHRDITPSNVMIRDGQLYLVDFGAVKVGTGESTTMTTVGTFGYMAPEQILGRATTQSDLYGLGMTFVALATGCEPGDLPQDPDSGQIDPSSVLSAPPHVQRTLLALIRPGVRERPRTARDALVLLDPAYSPVPALPAGPYVVPPHPAIRVNRPSPYRDPRVLSEQDKAILRQHSLKEFPVWAAVGLHYLTFGLFSMIHYGLQHDRLPEAQSNDPTAAKAIGFSFIPYFNLYWCVFAPLRLAERLNLQAHVRGRGDQVNRTFILVSAILGIFPYLNLVFGIPFWGIGVYKLQKTINALARERDAELDQLQLPPGAAPAFPSLPSPGP
jgi:serine/threonine protein kinase